MVPTHFVPETSVSILFLGETPGPSTKAAGSTLPAQPPSHYPGKVSGLWAGPKALSPQLLLPNSPTRLSHLNLRGSFLNQPSETEPVTISPETTNATELCKKLKPLKPRRLQ